MRNLGQSQVASLARCILPGALVHRLSAWAAKTQSTIGNGLPGGLEALHSLQIRFKSFVLNSRAHRWALETHLAALRYPGLHHRSLDVVADTSATRRPTLLRVNSVSSVRTSPIRPDSFSTLSSALPRLVPAPSHCCADVPYPFNATPFLVQ